MTDGHDQTPPADPVDPAGRSEGSDPGHAEVPTSALAVARAEALGLDEPVRASRPLGTVDAATIADVDAAGLVQLRGAQWSLDWWIGAEDRWHHPSLDAAVRQRTVEGAPLVETSMRVPGGDIVHRAYGVRARSAGDGEGGEWSDSAVVVEIENQTAVPVALALAVRPVTLDGDGRVASVSADGAVVHVDGGVGFVVSRELTRRTSGGVGHAARRLHAGEDEPANGALADASGSLEAAYVVPLPHGTTIRVMLPRVESRHRSSTRVLPGRAKGPAPVPGAQWDAPDLDAAVAGWAVHVNDLAAVELPEPTLTDVVAASEQTLMLAATDDFFDAGAGVTAAQRAAETCDALVRVGVSQPLEPIARALVDAQGLGGAVKLGDRSDATVALVHAVTPLLLGSRGEAWAEDLVGPAARAVHRLERGKGLDGGLERSAAVALGRLGPAMRVVGQPDVADAAESLSARLYSTLADTSSTAASDSVGAGHSTGSGEPGITSSDAGSTVAVTQQARRLRSVVAAAPGSVPTAQSAELLELARVGDPGAVADLVDDLGRSRGVRGLDPAAVAARLSLVLDLLVVEGADGPVLLPVWLDSWFGQQAEAHRVRTRWGLVSFAVRWHGARPALLWEIEPGAGVATDGDGPTWTAPGLDPSWSGRGWEGEALLGEVPVPEAVVSLGRPTRLAGTSPAPSTPAPSTPAPSTPAPSTPAPSTTAPSTTAGAAASTPPVPGEGDSFA